MVYSLWWVLSTNSPGLWPEVKYRCHNDIIGCPLKFPPGHSTRRHHRHSAVNDILHRALRSAKVPARLEPSGLTRSDGKRPDGVTLVPWRRGKPLVWDATCPDTLAFSYRANATAGAGEVAAMAEQKKLIKYDSLAPNYDIAPVAIESLGAIGPLSRALLKDLGRRIKESTGEARAHEYSSARKCCFHHGHDGRPWTRLLGSMSLIFLGVVVVCCCCFLFVSLTPLFC